MISLLSIVCYGAEHFRYATQGETSSILFDVLTEDVRINQEWIALLLKLWPAGLVENLVFDDSIA